MGKRLNSCTPYLEGLYGNGHHALKKHYLYTKYKDDDSPVFSGTNQSLVTKK